MSPGHFGTDLSLHMATLTMLNPDVEQPGLGLLKVLGLVSGSGMRV